MLKLDYKQYVLEIPDHIYLPSDDTYLMLDSLKSEPIKNYKKFLEIGVGNGILSLYLYKFCEQITVTDINPIVLNYMNNLKNKYNLSKLRILNSDIFSKLCNEKFDIIIFNPPYVPSDTLPSLNSLEDISTLGGNNGNEIILKFISELPYHLLDKGICYLLISDLNKPKLIFKYLEENKLKYKIINKKSLFFEKLFILKITHK